MTNWDIEYLKLCKKILQEGVEIENRTGINAVKIPSYSFEFDTKKEFPILESKQMFYRQAIIEMLWIWQMGSNNVKDLQDRNVHIWDEWMIDEDGIYRIYEPVAENYDENKEVVVLDPLSVPISNPDGKLQPKKDENGNILKAKSLIPGKNIRMAKYYGKEYKNTIGTAYGFIVNRYNHTKNLIETLKNNKNDRRMVKSLWQDEFLRTAVLPSCVWSTEWDVTNDTLNLSVHQRSCDVPLGLPFNVTQYATLLNMIAKETNLEPGKIFYSIKNPHIYVNQLDGIKEQLEREVRYNSLKNYSKEELIKLKNIFEKAMEHEEKDSDGYRKFDTDRRTIDIVLDPKTPKLELDDVESFFDYDNSKDLKNVRVKDYKHMGKIKFPLAQ